VLYDQNCLVCHGPNGEGRIGASLAKAWPSIRPDLQVKATIERGIEGSAMPAWSQANGGPLTDGEVDNLVAYILTWSTPANPATLAPTPVPEAPAQGTGLAVWLIAIVVIALVIVGVFYLTRRRA
jgi:mono/diheme cytochrome c family protein